jgi:hypothetical protein
MPKLGAAGTPYSRSVRPAVVPLGALPDPEAVYESVMARDKFIKNPNNVSSILWYWATIIIHGKDDLQSFFMKKKITRANYNNRLILDQRKRCQYQRFVVVPRFGSSIRP